MVQVHGIIFAGYEYTFYHLNYIITASDKLNNYLRLLTDTISLSRGIHVEFQLTCHMFSHCYVMPCRHDSGAVKSMEPCPSDDRNSLEHKTIFEKKIY